MYLIVYIVVLKHLKRNPRGLSIFKETTGGEYRVYRASIRLL